VLLRHIPWRRHLSGAGGTLAVPPPRNAAQQHGFRRDATEDAARVPAPMLPSKVFDQRVSLFADATHERIGALRTSKNATIACVRARARNDEEI